jgi:hypothetical protein
VTVEPLNWIKSSYSGGGGACVEWAPARAAATGAVPVRDSKALDGPVLSFPASAFSSFVAGVKPGEFDEV